MGSRLLNKVLLTLCPPSLTLNPCATERFLVFQVLVAPYIQRHQSIQHMSPNSVIGGGKTPAFLDSCAVPPFKARSAFLSENRERGFNGTVEHLPLCTGKYRWVSPSVMSSSVFEALKQRFWGGWACPHASLPRIPLHFSLTSWNSLW